MPRLTLADIRASRIRECLNRPPDDTRVVQIVNEATQRLLQRGHWWGTMAKYSIQAMNGLITLPKQIASIEKVAVAQEPVPVRNEIWEFIGNGWGTRSDTIYGGTSEAIFRGRFPTYFDVIGTNKKLRMQCDSSADVGKEVRIFGYDENANWIRTGDPIADGEPVTLLQTPGSMTTKKFSAVTDV